MQCGCKGQHNFSLICYNYRFQFVRSCGFIFLHVDQTSPGVQFWAPQFKSDKDNQRTGLSYIPAEDYTPPAACHVHFIPQ